MVLISNLTLVFEKFEPNYPNLGILAKHPQIRVFWTKNDQLLDLKEMFPIRYFEGADFKPSRSEVLSSLVPRLQEQI